MKEYVQLKDIYPIIIHGISICLIDLLETWVMDTPSWIILALTLGSSGLVYSQITIAIPTDFQFHKDAWLEIQMNKSFMIAVNWYFNLLNRIFV